MVTDRRNDLLGVLDESEGAFGYPRPQFVRNSWLSLDGAWDFGTTDTDNPRKAAFDKTITVPYPPESERSGVNGGATFPVVWYRRIFRIPDDWLGQRIILHFGAVDYDAAVWINGQFAVRHQGGHVPFSVDITDLLISGDQEIVVRAHDDPADMEKPRGKQDWLDEPHVIWYPRTTGIWQSVWLEPVPQAAIENIRYRASLETFSIDADVEVTAAALGMRLEIELLHENERLLHKMQTVQSGRVKFTLSIPDPGIDDARNHFLWSPERPNLLTVRLNLCQGETVSDSVGSYTALRTVGTRNRKFLLNGRPYFLRMVLDQGYWDDSLLAPPDDAALRHDVRLAKVLGFNGVRKHQKIEHPRYLYWADRLGLLVWEELPSAYSFSFRTGQRLMREWLEVMARDINHPSIVAWVPFNESWGVPDLPLDDRQRHLVQALYHQTKALDDSRVVMGNDGWEFAAGDMLSIHDYTQDPSLLAERYGALEAQKHSLGRHLPAGRLVALPGCGASAELPFLVSEFGGIRYSPDRDGWGYGSVETAADLLELYAAMIRALPEDDLAGFCYTQFADTFQEKNGLLFSNRDPKIPPEKLFDATRGET